MTTINEIVKKWVKYGNPLPELVYYHLGGVDFEFIEESGVFNDEELQYLANNYSYRTARKTARLKPSRASS